MNAGERRELRAHHEAPRALTSSAPRRSPTATPTQVGPRDPGRPPGLRPLIAPRIQPPHRHARRFSSAALLAKIGADGIERAFSDLGEAVVRGRTKGAPQRLAEYAELFQATALPAIATEHHLDSSFARMRLAGANPAWLELRVRLGDVERTIDARNLERPSYRYLRPSETPQSINI